MKNNFSEVTAAGVSAKQVTGVSQRAGKLSVAYVNKGMNDNNNSSNEGENTGSVRQRASVLCSSGGKYYINGIPILMNQENDAGIYDEEISGYY